MKNMNPDDPNYRLAQGQFEGIDERILEQLISDAEAEVHIKEMSLASFGLHASQLDQLEQAGPGSDALQISEENRKYILSLRRDLAILQEHLDQLKAQKIKKDSPGIQ